MRSAYSQIHKWLNHIHGKRQWESIVAKTQRNVGNKLRANTLISASNSQTVKENPFQGFPWASGVVSVQRISRMVQ
jgi:hypothetical protein